MPSAAIHCPTQLSDSPHRVRTGRSSRRGSQVLDRRRRSLLATRVSGSSKIAVATWRLSRLSPMRDPAHCGDRVEGAIGVSAATAWCALLRGSVSTSQMGPSAHCIRVPPSVSSSRTRRTRSRSCPATVVSAPCGPGRRAATPQCQHPAVHLRGGLGPVDLGVLGLEEARRSSRVRSVGDRLDRRPRPVRARRAAARQGAEHPPEDVLWPLSVVDRSCPLGEQTAGVEVAVDAMDAVAELAVAVAYGPA